MDNNQVQKKFTTQELAKYDGKNGNPSYVAIDGIVYDLSAVFRRGKHHHQRAGQDLTEVYCSRHNSKTILQKFPVVGTLKQ